MIRSALCFAPLLVALVGCSSTDPPAPEALFGNHPAATENKLQGVYEIEVDEPSQVITIRLGFVEDTVVGAVRCKPKSDAPALEAFGSVEISTDNIEDANGSFEVLEPLNMTNTQGDVICEAGLRPGPYRFAMNGLILALTTPNLQEPINYGKVGDIE